MGSYNHLLPLFCFYGVIKGAVADIVLRKCVSSHHKGITFLVLFEPVVHLGKRNNKGKNSDVMNTEYFYHIMEYVHVHGTPMKTCDLRIGERQYSHSFLSL